MKTSRSNSFRLHRITKGSSLKKWNQGDSLNTSQLPFKLDLIHSVNKGVKYNDLSYITGRQLNKLRKQPASQTDLGYQSAQMNMTDMRKKYDDIKKKSYNLEKAIFHLKQEKQRYLLKFNGFDTDKNKGKNKVQNLQIQLHQKKLQLTVVQTQKNVLKSVVQRHHTDKVIYDQKKFNLEQQYSHLKKQLKIFLKEGTGVDQNSDRASKVYQKFLKQLQAQKKQRQDHLRNAQKLLFTKASVFQSNEIRGLEIQEIAERAMLDKNLNEKQWEKIFMTHKLLSHMLKNKIEREMEKFSTVQFAFKEIKTATGVTDAQVLVQKYLNKEEVYGDLLSKISQNQKRIQILKNQTDALLIEQKNLESEKQVYQNIKITQLDLHDDLKQLEVFQNKSLSAQLLKTKLINWLEKQSKKLLLFDKKPASSNQPKTFIELFKEFYQKLIESVKNSEKIEEKYGHDLKDEIHSEKILRISPKKPKINDKGQQIYQLDEQEGNVANIGKNQFNQAEQNEVLINQREQVLKSNQKFMKQLRKKKEQMRRVLIQVMEKQKKEKPKVQTKKDD